MDPILSTHNDTLVNKISSLQTKSNLRSSITNPSNLNTTRSGLVFKNRQASAISQSKDKKFKQKENCELEKKPDYSNSELNRSFRKKNHQQQAVIRDLFEKGELKYQGGLRLRRNIADNI